VAFSLIELIGVLAVIAVLAAVVVPSAIRYLDRVAARREVAALKVLGDSFQKAILRQRTIPVVASWRSFIAAEAGMSSNAVSVNPRNRQRAFVADPGGWLAGNLPYVNSPNGSATYPSTARAMVISSLGAALPANLEASMTAQEFQKLWSTPEGSIPSASPAIWDGWQGDPYDIKIQRLNLGPLFHRLVLSTYTAATNGQFDIDKRGTNNLLQAVQNAPCSAYYLEGTVVDLYTGGSPVTTNHSLIINDDVSFVYEYGIWRNSIVGGETYGLGDVSGIVAAFLAATPNSKAELTNGNAQQVAIVNSFVQYLSNYSNWAESDFPSATRDNMVDIQKNMMSNVWGLFDATHYPTNAAQCMVQ
jgi:type II secretory pathway pseudopilin PulG